jgi:hypothetical protein
MTMQGFHESIWKPILPGDPETAHEQASFTTVTFVTIMTDVVTSVTNVTDVTTFVTTLTSVMVVECPVHEHQNRDALVDFFVSMNDAHQKIEDHLSSLTHEGLTFHLGDHKAWNKKDAHSVQLTRQDQEKFENCSRATRSCMGPLFCQNAESCVALF